jgi:hypothetical protein
LVATLAVTCLTTVTSTSSLRITMHTRHKVAGRLKAGLKHTLITLIIFTVYITNPKRKNLMEKYFNY